MEWTLLWLASSGGLGGVARWGLTRWVDRFWQGRIPWGTVVVNAIGCLLLGVFAGAFFGSLLRWFLTGIDAGPYYLSGLLLANLMGSFLIGWLYQKAEQGKEDAVEFYLAFGATGFCGGLTSFSSLYAWWWLPGDMNPVLGFLFIQGFLLLCTFALFFGRKLARSR